MTDLAEESLVEPDSVVSVIVTGAESERRSRISELIGNHPRISVAASAVTAHDAVDSARGRRERPVIVLDLKGIDNQPAAARECAVSFPVVVIAKSNDDPEIPRLLQAGAAACLVNESITSQQVVEAVTKAAVGDSYLAPTIITRLFEEFRRSPKTITGPGGELTEREREIMGLVSQGLRNRQIAAALFLSEKTVKNHINHIYRKLQVSDRNEAVERWGREA